MLFGILNHRFVELTQEFLSYGHVVEVVTAGSRMIFTDEPDMFKAVMSTNVWSHS